MLIDVMLPGFTCQSSSVTSGDLFLLGFFVDEVSLGMAPSFRCSAADAVAADFSWEQPRQPWVFRAGNEKPSINRVIQ